MKFIHMLTISETAALIGVTPATLRRWDKKGYLVPKRTLGNHRRYTWEQLADFLPDSVEFEKSHNFKIISLFLVIMEFKKLPVEIFSTVQKNLKNIARPLEREIFSLVFEQGTPDVVLNEIVRYQNRDGGFGLGIEPDFHLPMSTPLATSIGLKYLHFLNTEFSTQFTSDLKKKVEDYIEQALHSLITSFDIERKGWYAVRSEVNDYPHAPWWHWDEVTRQTPIDAAWGNPTIELTGYFYYYRHLLPEKQYQDFIQAQLKRVIEYFSQKTDFNSEHELFCTIRLYWMLDNEKQKQILPALKRGIQEKIVLDSSLWEKYVAKPLDFVDHPERNHFEISETAINENLVWIINKLTQTGMIEPNWDWSGQYETFWQNSKKYWIGILSLRYLLILQNFSLLSN
ncbi:MAG: hypothetical protein DRO88_09395 [Promethearchaeia archaeon]|nr:MAG: hypothetical protein DRO88_09395 [Candidatus Lokiarchaeia archaeon]